MSVRAKFKVDSVEHHVWIGSKLDENKNYTTTKAKAQTIKMTPVSGQEGENKAFWEASPSGDLRLCMINPEAGNYFIPGEEYYIDFTKAE